MLWDYAYGLWFATARIRRSIISLLKTRRLSCRWLANWRINTEILQAILAFCVYELSPQKIGATLVWCLEDLNPTDVQRLLPNSSTGSLQEQIQLDVREGVDRSILCHILTYTDGAVFLTPEGIVAGGGAHLKYSETSRSLIPAYRGTRHTSAKRFSFDFSETVVFAVSSDGLVTVFSGGMNIVHLTGNGAVPEAEALAAFSPDLASPSTADLVECQRCRKIFKIQMANLAQVEQQVPCPVCRHILNSTCWNVLEVYVIKQRSLSSPLSSPLCTLGAANPQLVLPSNSSAQTQD